MPLPNNNAGVISRITLSIVGGFILTSLFCVRLPQILHGIFALNLTAAFMWCLLSGFALYCILIIWVISTRALLRTTLLMGLSIIGLYLSLPSVNSAVGGIG